MCAKEFAKCVAKLLGRLYCPTRHNTTQMTTNEQLAALGRVAMRLQAENNKLRDSLTEILERTGYFIKEANPRIYQEAQEALRHPLRGRPPR